MEIPVCPPQDLENEFARQIQIIKWSDLAQDLEKYKKNVGL